MTDQIPSKKPSITLLIHTPHYRYAVQHADITSIRSCTSPEEIARWGTPDRPGIAIDLGEFLNADTPVWSQRTSALIVTMRRRPIAFVVRHIEQMIEHAPIQPLPEVIRTALRNHWATGVLENQGTLSIVLDLRELARSILVGHTA